MAGGGLKFSGEFTEFNLRISGGRVGLLGTSHENLLISRFLSSLFFCSSVDDDLAFIGDETACFSGFLPEDENVCHSNYLFSVSQGFN